MRQPKTQKYVKEKLKRWCEENPQIDVVRFTTFFHQFTLTFDDKKREKFVEWFGYSASVSPYILEKFEKWAGYKFRPEFIVDQGYHNSMFRVPSREFKDFIEFQQQEVCALAKELVDIVHSYGKEAMMFWESLDRDGTIRKIFCRNWSGCSSWFCWQWCDTPYDFRYKRG